MIVLLSETRTRRFPLFVEASDVAFLYQTLSALARFNVWNGFAYQTLSALARFNDWKRHAVWAGNYVAAIQCIYLNFKAIHVQTLNSWY